MRAEYGSKGTQICGPGQGKNALRRGEGNTLAGDPLGGLRGVVRILPVSLNPYPVQGTAQRQVQGA